MPGMNDLEPLLRSWRAQDALFERVESTWWGAVVSDARYPRIQEANCARVETREPVRLEEIRSELLPAMARSGSSRSHVVVFHPEDQIDLVAAASTLGERISWDLVMVFDGTPPTPPSPDPVVEVDEFDDGFWALHRESSGLFGIELAEVIDQLQAIERDLLIPAGRRWFAVSEPPSGPEPDRNATVAVAALLVLERVGFVDHVATFPAARRRGYASALTRRVLAEAAAMGAECTYLLAEPGGDAARIYERLGFAGIGHLASWISPITP
jgi:ribosomal protein S18 acetylase RimI-like enzyme